MREGAGVRQGKIGPVRCADRIYSMESWHLALRGLVLPLGELHLTALKGLFLSAIC